MGNGISGNVTASVGVAVNNSSTLVTNLAPGATFTPAIALNGATTTLKAIQTGVNTLGGAITGAGVFDQNGTGTTILAATDTYTAATNVNAGTLQIGNGSTGDAHPAPVPSGPRHRRPWRIDPGRRGRLQPPGQPRRRGRSPLKAINAGAPIP